MTYSYSIHIEAPVTTVFAFFRDPSNWMALEPDGVRFEDVRLTEEGLGTHYSWSARIAGLSLEGFDVFTEFIPNERITDTSSSAMEGTWTFQFEPEGAGTKLTVQNQSRSFWKLPPLGWCMDWAAGKTHEPRFTKLKAMLEE